ncbi:MAG: nitroreductase family protein [Bacteroidales bacterium]
MELAIDKEACIKCNKCARVCPVAIFRPNSESKEIELFNIENCIVCGHCAAVCPTKAVIHSEFPPQKVHPIDYTALPTAEQMINLIRARRSNRAFSKKEIPNESLELIIEAAYRAPTASNKQQVKFLLITDSDTLLELSRYTIGVFSSIVKKLDNPIGRAIVKPLMPEAFAYVPAFKKIASEFDNGNDMIMRKAKAALIIYTPKNNRFGSEDSNLAYQNASLMAESLGVAQFYMGFVISATKQDKSNALAKKLGIEGKIHAAMAMAMPSFKYENYIDKKAIDIKRL